MTGRLTSSVCCSKPRDLPFCVPQAQRLRWWWRRSRPLSLITLDIQLPGIDGWEFLARIREKQSLAQVPVVIISGIAHTQPDADERRRRRTAKAHQPRPVEGHSCKYWSATCPGMHAHDTRRR